MPLATAIRMAAAGVGIFTAPSHTVRGALGEDRAVLSVDPPWLRALAVFSRVPLTGAAAALTELLTTLPDTGIRPLRPFRPRSPLTRTGVRRLRQSPGGGPLRAQVRRQAAP